jgi:hypothetical protein
LNPKLYDDTDSAEIDSEFPDKPYGRLEYFVDNVRSFPKSIREIQNFTYAKLTQRRDDREKDEYDLMVILPLRLQLFHSTLSQSICSNRLPYHWDWEAPFSARVSHGGGETPWTPANDLSLIRQELLQTDDILEPLVNEEPNNPIVSTSPWESSMRVYLVSSGWLAIYSIAAIAAAAASLYLFAHQEYLYLPASVFAFFGFVILALIRLSAPSRTQPPSG